MTAGMRETWSTDGPGKYESVPPVVRMIDTRDAYDATTGDVDAPTGWVGLAGRWIVRHDTRGAVTADRYRTRDDASDAFEWIDAEYGAWWSDAEAEAGDA